MSRTAAGGQAAGNVGTSATGSTVGGWQVPPGFTAFMEAVRLQESGGNYTDPGGGAYQYSQGRWDSHVANAGWPAWQGRPPQSAPPVVQDQVAAYDMLENFYGPAQKSWRLLARIWNGGTPNVLPNPALGAGATTDTYASQVLAKMQAIEAGRLPGGPAPRPGAYVAGGQVVQSSSATDPRPAGFCQHPINLGVGTVCMDKFIAGSVIAAGGVLVLAGVAVILVAAAKDTGAGQAAAKALAVTPAGRMASGGGGRRAGSASPAQADPGRVQERQEEAHAQRMSHREEAHAQRMNQTRVSRAATGSRMYDPDLAERRAHAARHRLTPAQAAARRARVERDPMTVGR